METSLKGKVVYITGSSRGIGRETAFKFSKEECRLAITYYKEKDEAEKVKKECEKLGAKDVLVIRLNLINDKSIKSAVDKIVKRFGHIDILINNAGVVAWKKLKDQGLEEIEAQIRTNLEGLIKNTKACLPYLKEAIINIASGAGQTGYVDLAPYCAAKFGVRGFSQALAQELNRVKIYVVNPGMTATRMTNFTGTPPEKVAQVILDTAKGRYKIKSGNDINVWEIVKE